MAGFASISFSGNDFDGSQVSGHLAWSDRVTCHSVHGKYEHEDDIGGGCRVKMKSLLRTVLNQIYIAGLVVVVHHHERYRSLTRV